MITNHSAFAYLGFLSSAFGCDDIWGTNVAKCTTLPALPHSRLGFGRAGILVIAPPSRSLFSRNDDRTPQLADGLPRNNGCALQRERGHDGRHNDVRPCEMDQRGIGRAARNRS
jgi:hypothetical protein